MGSSARLTLVLLLIFVLGTALLLDGKRGDQDGAAGTSSNPDLAVAGVGSLPLAAGGDTRTPGGGEALAQLPPIPATSARPAPVPVPEVTRRPQPDRPADRVRRNTGTGEFVEDRGSARRETPAPVGPSGRTATVRPNDSWWRLAKRELGSGNHWKALQAANPGVKLHPGVKVALPQVSGSSSGGAAVASRGDSGTRSRPRARTVRSSGPRTHTVRPGEKLWNIAVQHYGRGHLYYKIAEHNGITDPDKVRVGTELRIPALP